MKTILLSLALGSLLFAGCLKVVERRAEPVPAVVEAPPAPLETFVVEVEEPIETHVVSRADPAWRKQKPVVRQALKVQREELDYSTFSRYAPLGVRAVPEAPVPDYSRFSRAMPPLKSKSAPARID